MKFNDEDPEKVNRLSEKWGKEIEDVNKSTPGYKMFFVLGIVGITFVMLFFLDIFGFWAK
jgi:hypothetical protein